MRWAIWSLATAVLVCGPSTGHAQYYLDVLSWEGGEYDGAWVVDDDSYPEVGQTFVPNTSGVLAGISLNCSREGTHSIRINVYEFRPSQRRTGALVASSRFDVSDVSEDPFAPTERYFAFGEGVLAQGQSYLFSVEILDGEGFFLQANTGVYADGEMWTRGGRAWTPLSPGDSDFKTWVQGGPACQSVRLGSLGGSLTSVHDLNERAQVVGASTLPGDTVQHASLWERGRIIDLGASDADGWSEAQAINNQGLIVGGASVAGVTTAASWKEGRLALLPGRGRIALDVNERGQIVGISQDDRCLFWPDRNSEPIVLPGLGGPLCVPWALNDVGTIVGLAQVPSGYGHAFVWRDGVTIDVNAGVGTPTPPDMFYGALFDINNAGLAVGALQTGAQPLGVMLWSAARGPRMLEVAGNAAVVNAWGTSAILAPFEGDDTRLVLVDRFGRSRDAGRFRGGVGSDGFALNDYAQIAWTVLVPNLGEFQSYFCQLP